MSEPRNIAGRCLCGAVTVEAVLSDDRLTSCHCDMCRRHTSSVFVGVAPEQSSLKVEGPAKSFRSSDWAERGFCAECGSTLWYGTQHDGARYLAAGLFDNAAGGTVTVEYFADRCPHGYRLETVEKRLSAEETIAFFEGGGEAGA
ncbi:MAG: GFA family protein [Pseudomonadota bacterium]